MRYSASVKFQIISIVEKPRLPVRKTLQKLGIPSATFCRWFDLFRLGDIDALENNRPLSWHVWS